MIILASFSDSNNITNSLLIHLYKYTMLTQSSIV